jgi:hypothetical protein
VDALRRDGLSFMDYYADPTSAFNSLLTNRSRDVDFGVAGLSMPGNPDSPRWRDTALALGHLIMDNPRPAIWGAPVLTK